MHVGKDKNMNINTAISMIRDAASKGAELVVLPEMFIVPFVTKLFYEYAENDKGELYHTLSNLAKELKIYLVAGSMPVKCGDKVTNTGYFFDKNGNEIACHKKAHLFDAVLMDGTVIKESDAVVPGNSITMINTEYGTFAYVICFDIRFSEFFSLMGNYNPSLIIIPAAFNMTTGPKHWEITNRMRALDQQCFIVSCAPSYDVNDLYVSYAHSMVCGPDGDKKADAGINETVLIYDIDFEEIEKNRRILPIKNGRRLDIYKTEEEVV